MAAAFYTAGLEPYDVTMSDLPLGEHYLGQFPRLVFPGGFSFKDVFDSAKGWAGVIRFNPGLRAMFDRFYNRSDTFTLGVCTVPTLGAPGMGTVEGDRRNDPAALRSQSLGTL